MDKDLNEELQRIEAAINNIDTKVSAIVRAFPTNESGEIDAETHRQYHEALIRSAKQQEAFWQSLKEDLIKKGVWAVILVVIGLIVTGLGVKLGFRTG